MASVFLFVIFTVLCAGYPASAQEPEPHALDSKVNKEIARMTKRYALSDAQKAQIEPILVEEQNKLDAVSQNSSLAPGDRFKKIKAIHDEQVPKVSAVLSDSQRTKYQEDEKKRSKKDQEKINPQQEPNLLSNPGITSIPL